MQAPIPVVLRDDLLEPLETAAADLAQQTGDLLLERFRGRLTVEYKSAGHQDPVTDADRAAEQFLAGEIRSRFPTHGVLGEEGNEPPPGSEFVWVVDPLDGTTNFINGLPLWAVSIGVLWHGRPVAGAIFTPAGPGAEPATFHARHGRGAWLNDQPLALAHEPHPTRRRLATLPAHYWHDLRFRTRGPGELGEARTLGSVALEMALISAGAIQYGIFWGPKIWDVAAGVCIVREAGGQALRRQQGGRTWGDLYAFEAGRTKRREGAALRHWRGAVVAGAAPAAAVVANDIGARRRLTAPISRPARSLTARLTKLIGPQAARQEP